jgi:hypothetical protein
MSGARDGSVTGGQLVDGGAFVVGGELVPGLFVWAVAVSAAISVSASANVMVRIFINSLYFEIKGLIDAAGILAILEPT